MRVHSWPADEVLMYPPTEHVPRYDATTCGLSLVEQQALATPSMATGRTWTARMVRSVAVHYNVFLRRGISLTDAVDALFRVVFLDNIHDNVFRASVPRGRVVSVPEPFTLDFE